jgi:hypothetical protein
VQVEKEIQTLELLLMDKMVVLAEVVGSIHQAVEQQAAAQQVKDMQVVATLVMAALAAVVQVQLA